MNIEEIIALLIILVLSFDTTKFLQSLISQPLFSCMLIGAYIGQMELALKIGFIAQLLSLSYIPVGGAKMPDFQIGSNLILVYFYQGGTTIEHVGQFLPVMIFIALVFMYLIELERKYATYYMKEVEYEDVNFKKLISIAIVMHFIVYGLGIFVTYFMINHVEFHVLRFIDGEKFYFFMLTFSLGALFIKYFKLSFKI